MFRAKVLPLGSSSLRVYLGRDLLDAFTTVADLSHVLNVQQATVRSEVAGQLVPLAELWSWLADEGLHPATGVIKFAPSEAWKQSVQNRVTTNVWDSVLEALEREREEPWAPVQGKRSRSPSLDLSSSNSSSSSDDDSENRLPQGVPAWVMTDPVIPNQFSTQDYTKSYALKDYDMSKSLKREFKKLRKWWTTERNAERKGAKSIQDTTADKREERILCFLGFVHRYKCCANLTLALFLNHNLFEAYLDYLKQVREASDGTIGEALTSAISACRWLYRKERSLSLPQVIRRYMDYRNTYQAQAVRERAQNDVDELQEQNKWIDWTDFTALIARLRKEWDETLAKADPTVAVAQDLHDLLLLGLYSCIPGRGAEVRLLQYIAENEIANETLKKYAKKHDMNLVTRIDGTWKMCLAKYKNVRQRGVDITEMSNFGWWTDLLQTYQQTYRSLLVKDEAHKFVFVTRQGAPFTANYYSEFLSTLIQRHTGQRVATNILRSSFVTHFYGSEDAKDPTMRESIATVMRHSVDQALRVYDRRSSAAKKHKGLSLLASKTAPPTSRPPRQVVQYQHSIYQVLEDAGAKLLVEKMTRSATSNAPIYFLPPDAVYQWQTRTECSPVEGQWDDCDFVLK